MRTRHQRSVESLIFFLDHNLGKYTIAERLRQQPGVEVQIHDDHFLQGATDEAWLREVGRRGWVVLTKDTRIRYRSHERAALMQAGVPVFVLVAGNLTGHEMAEAFVHALPAIRRFITQYPAPFIARITRRGAVSMLKERTA